MNGSIKTVDCIFYTINNVFILNVNLLIEIEISVADI